MKFPYLLLFAVGVPLLASAQTGRSMPASADADAPVAPLQYRSVFANYVTAKEAQESPDKGWIRANHALLGDEAKPSASSAQPTATSSQTASEQKHGKHEHKGTHQ